MKTIHFPTMSILLLLPALVAVGADGPQGRLGSRFSDRPASFLIPCPIGMDPVSFEHPIMAEDRWKLTLLGEPEDLPRFAEPPPKLIRLPMGGPWRERDLTLIAAETPPPDISGTLQRLQEQLDQQTKRLDRLYNALGPELAELEERAAAMKKQQEEDVALAMKPVFRAKEETFNSKLLFLPGSRRLALAGADRTIRLLALPQGKVDATLTGADGEIECLAVTADGKRLLAGTDKGTVFAWTDGKDPAAKITSTGEWPVTALAVSADGARVAWACNGKNDANGKWTQPNESLVMLDSASGRKLWGAIIGRGDFQALSFSADSTGLAVVQSGEVAVLDAATGQVVRQLKHEEFGPLSTALSRDGKVCAVGYAPNSIGLWDARTGKCLRILNAHSNWVVSLAFTPDARLLASSAGDTTASVWEVATGKEIGRLRFGDGSSYVNSVSISDDGHWLAAGRSGEYVVCDMPTQPSQSTPESPEQK